MKLFRLFCLTGWLLAGLSPQLRAQPAPRPDILLIMPDQMRGDCLSALGHPVVRTPHVDKLASQGVLFCHAYSTCPSCIPARHSLLTGLFPATSGVVGFAGRPIPYPTLPKLLGQAGYQTVLVGRCMHQQPKSEPYGFERLILGSTYVDLDDYDQFLRQAAPESGGIVKLTASLGLTPNGWAAKPWPLANELHPTAWIVGQARKVLAESPSEKPLFLTTSFFAPHPPLFPPKQYYEFYARQKLPAPAHGDWVDWKALTQGGDKPGHRVLLQGETLHATQAGYFGLIEQLDEQIEPLINEFKARSQKTGRPWLIVFTTDHGEMLGDHGFFRKCEPFEGSAHIPFIIAGSTNLGFKAGLRSEQPVCLEDVMPTLLGLAGVAVPQPMDGVNLAPVLRGERASLREELHFEHAPCYSQAQAFQALTDGHFKFIWRPLDGTEHLFALDSDPREEHDLTLQPSHRAEVQAWRLRLSRQLAHRPEGFVDESNHLVAGRPYRPLQARPEAPTPKASQPKS